MRVMIFLLFSLVGAGALPAQQQSALPRVFVLGQQEAAYDQLVQDHRQTLLEASGGNMETAFDHWVEMMRAVDDYAEKIKFDLNGIKVLLHVFWNEDGSIAHLGFFLRPDSRNVKTEDLTAFFTSFSGQYKFPVASRRKYAHYTKASFPTFDERLER